MKRGTLLILIALLIAASGFAFYLNSKRALAYKNKRHIIFLTNGQAYIGSLSHLTPEFVTLRDTYLVKNADELKKTNTKPKLVLTRVARESLGTDGVITINKDLVMSYEVLRDDSQINARIKESETATPTPAPQASP